MRAEGSGGERAEAGDVDELGTEGPGEGSVVEYAPDLVEFSASGDD